MSGERENGAPRVDVIVAAWNRADTIERAVTSALAQDGLGRVIVVDDASTDDTPARIAELSRNEPRLVSLRFAVNRGPAAARNAALALASAPYVTLLDGDDFLRPGRLAGLLGFAAGQDFVADDLLQVAASALDRVEPQPMLGGSFAPWALDFAAFVRGNVSRPGRNRRELGFFKPLMRRAFLVEHRLGYDESLRLGEDFDLYARALLAGARFLVVPAQGYVSVARPDSLSGAHGRADLERLYARSRALDRPGLTRPERAALAAHGRSLDARIQWLRLIEAVKARDPAACLRPFLRSTTVSGFLLRNLAAQAVRRGGGRLATLLGARG
ncbi:MAG: hypothetical protein RLZZ501_2368 [Pseudomonadota bacterium]|jgi:succinoglycan biosynthesis protein ExoU